MHSHRARSSGHTRGGAVAANLRFLVVLVLLAMLASTVTFAAENRASDSDVKAAYLYQFGQYVEWPSDPSPLIVCVAGDSAVAASLEKITRADRAPHKTIVRRDAGDALAPGGCAILFVGRGEQRGAALLKALSGEPTLIVGEDADFLRTGGMVAFMLQDRKVRFSINLTAAETAHLKLSSELLRHAVEVVQ